jgi:hypothetical protein
MASTYILHRATIPHPNTEWLQIEFEAREEFGDPTNHLENYQEVKWIMEQQAQGNHASWFAARVCIRATGTDFTGKPDWLGACSYKSFDDFIQCEYFKDMIVEATKNFMVELPGKIQLAQSTLKVLETIDKERRKKNGELL